MLPVEQLRYDPDQPVEFQVSRSSSSGILLTASRRATREHCRVCVRHGTCLPALIRSSLGRRKKCREQKRVARRAACRSTITAVISRSVISIRHEYRVYFSAPRPTQDRPASFCCFEKKSTFRRSRKEEIRRTHGAAKIRVFPRRRKKDREKERETVIAMASH